MKKVVLFLALNSLMHFSYGQRADWRTAEKYFGEFKYAAAAEAYEKITLQDSMNLKALEKLALCYHKLNDPVKAEIWLAKVCALPGIELKFYKMYAAALASNGKYEESAKWYAKYSEATSDATAKHLSTLHAGIDKFYADSSFYNISLLPFNSKYADFSPVFYKDSILFCSSRENTGKDKFGWNNSHYIDLYMVSNTNAQVVSFGAPVNSALHEGPATFSKGYDTMYFTRNNFVNNRKSASAEGIVKLKIFMSIYSNNAWGKEQEISINFNEFSVGHPALADNNTMYFVSDLPGGYGGTDLYVTTFSNGIWKRPVNLGPAINTSGNEMFPFVDQDNNLYFASTGHPGLGGLDIFRARPVNGTHSQPENMGYPINSSRDDFGLIIKGNAGFFSSNRGADPQDDNIYSFSINYSKFINLVAIDGAGKPIDNFIVSMIGKTTSQKTVEKVFTERVEIHENYSFQCSKEGYITNSVTLTAEQLAQLPNNHTIQVTLKEAHKNIRVNLMSLTGKNMAGGTVEIKNMTSGEVTKVEAGANGSVVVKLNAGQQYQLTGSHPGHKNKTISLGKVEDLDDHAFIPIILQTPEALFEKNEIGQMIELEIKYDLGKATIRKDAALELDKLVVFLRKNPTVKVELGSHTDSRGSSEANIVLSQKRAESAVRYVVNKGISSKRLIPIGYGEDDPKVKDASAEEEHQHNRRTTVKIVGI